MFLKLFSVLILCFVNKKKTTFFQKPNEVFRKHHYDQMWRNLNKILEYVRKIEYFITIIKSTNVR